MRNIEDCKAEVFRRSEERIKERKRTRNRVLAWCISLCLLLVAGGIYIRPLLKPVDELGGINADGYTMPNRELGGLDYALHCDTKLTDTTTGSTTPESTTTGYTSVTVTDRTGAAEVSLEIKDKESVEALCGFMAMYFDMSVAKESILVGKAEQDGTIGQDWDTIVDGLEIKYGLDDKPADYKLVFRNSTGEEIVFRLYENRLYHEENGCVVKLSEKQLSELKEQLESAKGHEIDK